MYSLKKYICLIIVCFLPLLTWRALHNNSYVSGLLVYAQMENKKPWILNHRCFYFENCERIRPTAADNAFIVKRYRKSSYQRLRAAWRQLVTPPPFSPVDTDPPPASWNRFHRHMSDILGARCSSPRPSRPVTHIRVPVDLYRSVWTRRRRSCVPGSRYFSGRITRRRAPGLAAPESRLPGIHHFQVNWQQPPQKKDVICE